MGVRADNSTNYVHSDEPNLLNIHKAMDYNALGQPILRTMQGIGDGFGNADAFGRQKVAEPYTLFDSQHRYAKNDKFWELTATSGTATHDANASLVNMNVTADNGSSVIMESKRVFPYQPGKALEIFATFTMAASATGRRQRVGYFTTNNGVFLEKDGDTVYLVLRSYVSGSLVENRVAQDNWNGNKLNGTGETPITLDLEKSQILFIDIEWLGVGSVRCGFVINGAFILAHTFNHANLITGTYMTTAALPVRYEITNTSATSGAATLKHICSSVIINGGYKPSGKQRTAGRGLTYYTAATAGTFYHLVSIRLDSARLDDVVIPDEYNVMTDSNQNLQYKLVLNATFASSLVFSDHSEGTVEYSTTDSAVTAEGTTLTTGYIVNKGEAGKALMDLNELQLTRDGGTSTANILSLICTADNNNVKMTGNIGWFEPMRG